MFIELRNSTTSGCEKGNFKIINLGSSRKVEKRYRRAPPPLLDPSLPSNSLSRNFFGSKFIFKKHPCEFFLKSNITYILLQLLAASYRVIKLIKSLVKRLEGKIFYTYIQEVAYDYFEKEHKSLSKFDMQKINVDVVNVVVCK